MAKKKDYIDEFIEAQEKQYRAWEYTTQGRPTPFLAARGNPKPLAIAWFIGGGLVILLAIYLTIAEIVSAGYLLKMI